MSRRERALKKGPRGEIVAALSRGYRWRSEMFRWFVLAGLEGLGLHQRSDMPDDARSAIHEALEAYVRCLNAEPFASDVLGPVYMQLGSLWGRQVLAQHFTPQCVSRAVAMCSLANAEDGPRPDGGLWRLMEPAAGSGAMLLSAMQVIAEQHGAAGLRWWSFAAVDLDDLCARMTTLQLMANCEAHDAPLGELVVCQGNALERSDTWRLVVHAVAQKKLGASETAYRKAA